ncbi:MAG: copper resistance protein CopC [Actinobacteria bacterium]|nr:copper resistance protein CopC [Actinomycetota bacterium]
MKPFHTTGRAISIALVAVLALVAGATSASAHAGLGSSSPANGARLAAAPKAVTLVFEEKVSLDGTGTRIIDENGKTVPADVTSSGRKVTLVPASRLAPGRYAVAWHVISADRDAVDGAISFTVATPNGKGPSVVLPTMPKVPTTLSAALPGARTLTFTTRARSGQVEWTSSKLREPITWTVKGNGTTARSRGVLPMPGTWSFTATLVNGTGVVVVKGKATLAG